MTEDRTSWLSSHLATQALVLVPVIVIAGFSGWTIAAPSAKGQSATPSTVVAVQDPSGAASEPVSAAPDASALNGLKISSQSWRRAGLGSNALVTFTLRNSNDYAVRDIQVACAFTRQDGSHLTDRKRVIPGAVVDMRSRKTFARVHIGFVNIYANKAKCAPIAASRV
jgi:hypothetical protein